MKRSGIPFGLALVLLLLPGVASADFLVVDVRSDFTPGADVAFVRVLVYDFNDERRSWHAFRPVGSGDDFLSGARVAEFDNVNRGVYRVVVELLDGRMRPVQGRVIALSMPESAFVMTALISRP